MKIFILNGPNLNLIGKREPEVYGTVSLDSYLSDLQQRYSDKVELVAFQSNSESELIDKLHAIGYGEDVDQTLGVILNGGALTHTSLALGDAVRAIPSAVIEVHISNIHARETFRQHSYTAAAAVGVITGLGLEGYRAAIDWFLNKLS